MVCQHYKKNDAYVKKRQFFDTKAQAEAEQARLSKKSMEAFRSILGRFVAGREEAALHSIRAFSNYLVAKQKYRVLQALAGRAALPRRRRRIGLGRRKFPVIRRCSSSIP